MTLIAFGRRSPEPDPHGATVHLAGLDADDEERELARRLVKLDTESRREWLAESKRLHLTGMPLGDKPPISLCFPAVGDIPCCDVVAAVSARVPSFDAVDSR